MNPVTEKPATTQPRPHLVRIYHGQSGQRFTMRDHAGYVVAKDGAIVRTGPKLKTKKERNREKRARRTS